MVKKINEAEFAEVSKSKYAVVDFNATWCGPCKMLGPVLEEVSEAVSYTHLTLPTIYSV